jgi:Palmitoyl protein thioesterase
VVAVRAIESRPSAILESPSSSSARPNFQDPEDMKRYLELSEWLADINNEREEKNKTYATHLSSLKKFVMIRFSEEKTVVPPDSSVSVVRSGWLLTVVVWGV